MALRKKKAPEEQTVQDRIEQHNADAYEGYPFVKFGEGGAHVVYPGAAAGGEIDGLRAPDALAPASSPELDDARARVQQAREVLDGFEQAAADKFAARDFEGIEQLHADRRRARLELWVAERDAAECEVSLLRVHADRIGQIHGAYAEAFKRKTIEARRVAADAQTLEGWTNTVLNVALRTSTALNAAQARLADRTGTPAAVFDDGSSLAALRSAWSAE